MVFSSAVFLWLFLPIVFILNLILPKKCSNIFLLVASLVFYAWGEPYFVFLMLITIMVNFLIGICIDKYAKFAKHILTVGIILDIAILGYFKYANFLVDTINAIIRRQLITPPQILLPIGISFFTFQAMSYIVDVYRKDTKPSYNIINVALYIAYFPQLIAGPIVKYKEINKQIEDRRISLECVALGFRRFIYGLGKKVILSNILAKSVDIVFDLSLDNVGVKTAWFAVFMYSLQLYYDFSGYSDMAIGLGKMFGFDIPENFNLPYISRSVTEYWRRWHISLGTWFREYVYIPLGGSRKGTFRTYFNTAVIFMLTGLWHGASMSYVAWGVWQATLMVLERWFLKKKLDERKILSHIYFWVTMLGGLAIFRINNLRKSSVWLVKMASLWKIADKEYPIGNYMNGTSWFVLAIAFVGCGFWQMLVPEKIKEKWRGSVIECVYCAVVLLVSLSLVASSTYNPFIYFQF